MWKVQNCSCLLLWILELKGKDLMHEQSVIWLLQGIVITVYRVVVKLIGWVWTRGLVYVIL